MWHVLLVVCHVVQLLLQLCTYSHVAYYCQKIVCRYIIIYTCERVVKESVGAIQLYYSP